MAHLNHVKSASTLLIEQNDSDIRISIAVTLALSSGILLNGFNSAAGQAVCCIVNCTTLILLLLARPLYPRRWKQALPVLLLISAATAWAAFASGFPAIYAGPIFPRPFAPDFLELGFLSQVSGIAALLCGVILGGIPRSQRTAIDALIAIGCLYLLLGLVFRAAGTDGVLSYWTVERDGRFQGTLGNVNVAAAVAGVLAILSLSRLIAYIDDRHGRRHKGDRALRAGLYCFALLVGIGAAFATASRFTILFMSAILIGLAVLRHFRRRRSLRGAKPVLVATAVVVIILSTQFSGLLIERLATMGAGLALRQTMWQHYYDVAVLSPLYGYGWGSFPTIAAHFPGTLPFAQGSWSVNSAHNILLQLWLNGGIPYLLLMLASFGFGIRQVVSGLDARWATDDIGIALAVLLIVGCSLIDIVLDVPATITLGLLLMGLLWGRALVRLEIRVAVSGCKGA